MGVFICCPSHSLPPLQARTSKILTDIAAGQEFKGHQPHQHLALLHYCYTKKKWAKYVCVHMSCFKFPCFKVQMSDYQLGRCAGKRDGCVGVIRRS